jgi:ABC-2 type transport system ATP-binding protein
MAEPTIQVRGLRVRRGSRVVLDEVSLSVPRGRVVGLLGPSGSGKTTLMRAIVGVQVVDCGEITVLDAMAGASSLRRRVAYVTQSPSVYPDLEVRQNLAYFARVLGVGVQRVAEVLREVDLVGYERQLVGRLSGGEWARVSLAVALLGQPEVLVLDEPTVGLDPVLRRELWQTFHVLADSGATLLVSSHVMDEAERCDELLLLRNGAVLASGTPEELIRRTGADNVEGAFLALVDDDTTR